MPSAFAHAVVGAALSSTWARPARVAWAPVALGFLAAAPDLDVVAFGFGISYEHPLGHRGFSHSLFFSAWVGTLSYPLWRLVTPAHARRLAVLSMLTVASHGFLDAFTDAGLGVGFLIPFENSRYFAPWRPILTSPLSLAAFFSERGLAVLASEAIWVGIPTVLWLAALAGFRRARRLLSLV